MTSGRSTRAANREKGLEEASSGSSDVKNEEDEAVAVEEVKKEEEEVKEEVKQEAEQDVKEEEADGKSLLHLTKKQRELFPYLSAIKTTTVENLSSRSSTRSGASAQQQQQQQQAQQQQQQQQQPKVEQSRGKSPLPKSRSHSPSSNSETSKPPSSSSFGKSYSRHRSSAVPVGRRRKTPRKPSSPGVVESESESDINSDEDVKTAVPKRAGEGETPVVVPLTKRKQEQVRY